MGKSVGGILEYSEERITALMKEYDRYIASCDYIRMPEVFEYIVNRPCSRFWVSNIRAAVVVGKMMNGYTLDDMRPTKKEMFQEIFDRYCKLKDLNPSMSRLELVTEVVSQPAPKFYLSASSAKIMVYKVKKEWYARKMRKIQLY